MLPFLRFVAMFIIHFVQIYEIELNPGSNYSPFIKAYILILVEIVSFDQIGKFCKLNEKYPLRFF